MRKRAQFKMPMQSESVPTSQPTPVTTTPKRRRFRLKKNWWIGITLIAIFFLVLFMNSYFNITSNVNINPDGTTLTDTFYLSGPDPYYNMRLVDSTTQTGRFPYYSSSSPDPFSHIRLDNQEGEVRYSSCPLSDLASYSPLL